MSSAKNRVKRLEAERDYDPDEIVDIAGLVMPQRQFREQLEWIGKYGRRIHESDEMYEERIAKIKSREQTESNPERMKK